MADVPHIRDALVDAVTRSKSPGAVAYVGNFDETFFQGAYGDRQIVPQTLPATVQTIYDLASLTKVVATTSAAMRLKEDGVIDLDQPIVEFLPVPAFKGITFRHLLTHTAGLAPGFAYYRQHTSVTEMVQHFSLTAVKEPPGLHRVYSDIGFMILGLVLEFAAKAPLQNICHKHIFEPLEMNWTRFNPPEMWEQQCAATELCHWRHYVVRGVVHDENAFAVGGVSGHAGLFSTVDDLATFCRALLSGKVVSESTLDEMTTLGQFPGYPWQGIGWLLDPWLSDAQGALPTRRAIGHTGWTGTSIWMDRDSGLFSIELGNTCHPSRRHRHNREFRQVFYTALAEKFYPKKCAAHTGLDRVVREKFRPLLNKRIALLTNSAAVDMLGRPILDVLALEPAVNVHLLYSPEHGLKGQAEAGAKVGSVQGTTPVISLYGDRKAPSGAELEEIDLFVVDLPDVGSRYYTYMATMKNCLEACARHRKPVLILDRPNPLGGVILEGPVATKTDSLVCCAPIPVRHGMTLGELATFFAAHMHRKPHVNVSLVDGWPRALQFPDCSLPWVPPSPNMPTPETALVYVGMCLIEGTNLNEGRGTKSPFTIFGAPWMDSKKVIDSLSTEAMLGCRLEAETYTPVSIPGKASSPRYQDQRFNGIRLTVENREIIRPFTLALALIQAVRTLHPQHFQWGPTFDVLAGSDRLRRELEAGKSALDIVSACEDDLARFDKKRPKLYT